MKLYRTKDYAAMSRKAANILSAHIIIDPCCTVGLATGATPAGMYAQLISWYEKGDIDFSGVTFINLDEYAGLAPDAPQSYAFFMREHFFSRINALEENINIPHGMAADLLAECRRYDDILSAHPIDIQVLGIGHDGHIGFNEPGTAFETVTHTVTLTESTVRANARFFDSPGGVPRQAVTMGIKSIMQAKCILLMASGVDKADILSRAFMGPVTPELPASVLQLHGNVVIVGDEAALSEM